MSMIKKAIIIVLVMFAVIQFIPVDRNQSDETLATDFTLAYDVPENVLTILKRSCYDCHSNNTKYPWYNKIQPASMLLEDHINQGKEELNFSEFGSYSERKKKGKFKSIVSQIEKEEMPLFSYTLIHRDAVLSETDKEIIINWIHELRTTL